VTHPYYPGETFTFTFPKVLPQAALDAERAYLALPDGERSEAYRVALIGVVAQALLCEPEGFDDFPTDEVMPENLVARSLRERVREYFDDERKPELGAIISGAWGAYKRAAIPAAYLKSSSDNGARASRVSQPTAAGASTL